MTHKTRRAVFVLLVLAFFIIGTSAAFYAQGYRVDLANMSLEKVGGIYVRSFPRAAVYLDNELIKEDFWFFQNGVLMNDLFPKKYEVKIVNENYEAWRQTVEVEPSLVSEIKFAVLFPKTRAIVPSATSTENFWIGENALIINSSGTLALEGSVLPGKTVLDQDFESNRILLQDKQSFYVYNYQSRSFANITTFLRSVDLPNFPKASLDIGSQDLILSDQNEIYLINIPSRQFTEITGLGTSTLEISPIAISRTYLAWTQFNKTKNSSSLIIYSKDRRTKTIYPNTFSGKTIQLEFKGDKLGLLQADGSFYLGDAANNNAMEKMASDALEFKFMDDVSRVAVRGKRILELFPLKNLDLEEYIRFELPQQESIKEMRWYKDGRHLFIAYPDKIIFLDIDDEYLEHYYEIKTGNGKYDPQTNRLYYLEGLSLKRIDFAE